MLATSSTVGSGGSGGVFGPSLFIGGMLGEPWDIGRHVVPHGSTLPGAMVLGNGGRGRQRSHCFCNYGL